MKISKRTVATYILLPAVLFLVLGWLMSPWLLDVVMDGNEEYVVSTSINALAFCYLWNALSLAWLAAVTSGCILFLKYKTAAQTVLGIVTGLVLTAVVSATIWLFFIQYKIATVISIDLPIGIGIGRMVIPVEHIPVYEIGLFASIVVLLTTVLFSFRASQKKRLKKLP